MTTPYSTICLNMYELCLKTSSPGIPASRFGRRELFCCRQFNKCMKVIEESMNGDAMEPQLDNETNEKQTNDFSGQSKCPRKQSDK